MYRLSIYNTRIFHSKPPKDTQSTELSRIEKKTGKRYPKQPTPTSNPSSTPFCLISWTSLCLSCQIQIGFPPWFPMRA